jgi:hypothetical protein
LIPKAFGILLDGWKIEKFEKPLNVGLAAFLDYRV